MGDQVEQLAEAGITDKAEATERLRHRLAKGSRRFRHLGNDSNKAKIEAKHGLGK